MAQSLPSKSLAAVVEEYRKPLNVRDINLAELGSSKVLVKLEVTGVCHTDLHVRDGDLALKPALPIVPGHEGVGHVVYRGSNVSKVDVGERVCVPWLHLACQNCEFCVDGKETLCQVQLNTGFSIDGTFSRYIVAEGDFVTKVPPTLSSEQAAPIACAGVTAYKALKGAQLKKGETVVVIGAGGGLGHLAIQYANHMGYKTIGVDVGKNEFLKKIGTQKYVDAGVDNMITKVLELTGGEGAHATICFVPNTTLMSQAIYLVRPDGRVVFVGLPPDTVSIDVLTVILKGIKISGSIVGTRKDLEEALEIAAGGHVHVQLAVKPFDEVNETLDNLHSGCVEGRIVLKF